MQARINWITLPFVAALIFFGVRSKSNDGASSWEVVAATRDLPGATQPLPVYLPSDVTFRQEWNTFTADANAGMKISATGYRWVLKPKTWDRDAILRYYDEAVPQAEKVPTLNTPDVEYRLQLNGAVVTIDIEADDQEIEIYESRPLG